jgi:hypothetical protein
MEAQMTSERQKTAENSKASPSSAVAKPYELTPHEREVMAAYLARRE